MIKLPEKIETNRLVISPLSSMVFGQLRGAIEESFEDLEKFLPWAYPHPSAEDTMDFIRHAEEEFSKNESLHAAALCKENGRLIGMCSLMQGDFRIPSGDIGYWVRSSEAGKGYASEMASAMRDWMLENNFKRIQIRADAENVKSCAIALKCGFKHEATLINYDYNEYEKKMVDTNFYTYLTV